MILRAVTSSCYSSLCFFWGFAIQVAFPNFCCKDGQMRSMQMLGRENGEWWGSPSTVTTWVPKWWFSKGKYSGFFREFSGWWSMIPFGQINILAKKQNANCNWESPVYVGGWEPLSLRHTQLYLLVGLGTSEVWKIPILVFNTRWWFQTFFMFNPTWGNDPNWLIFFKWVETTN